MLLLITGGSFKNNLTSAIELNNMTELDYESTITGVEFEGNEDDARAGDLYV